MAISGPTPTGLRIGGIASGFGNVPFFKTYVTLNITDTTTAIRKQVIARSVTFNRFVSSVPAAADPDLLYVGTVGGAHSLIRFPWPPYLRDSALLARATLELTPAAPINGLPGDSVGLVVDGARVDFGPKSPPSFQDVFGASALIRGSSDTVRVDVIREVLLWQSTISLPHPPLLFLSTIAEGSTFTEPQFHSSRTPAAAPRLRVTYQLPFDFERP